jgi:hypothetical protein
MWYRFLLSWYQQEKKECPYLPEDYGVSLDKDIVETLKKDKEESEQEYITRYYEMILDISSLCDELSKELFFYSTKLKNIQKNDVNLGRKIKKVWNKKKPISPTRIDEIIQEFKNVLPPTEECDRLGITSFIKESHNIFSYLYKFKKEKDVKYIFSTLVKAIWLYFLLNWNKTNHSKYIDENNPEKLNRKCPHQPKDYGIVIEEETLEKTGMLQNESNDEYQERFIDLLNTYRTHYKIFIKQIIDICKQQEDD